MGNRLLLASLFVVGIALDAQASRSKEPLEAFDLGSLRVFSIVNGKCELVALVDDPRGYRHRVIKGSYLGRRDGLVVEITQRHIKVREFVDETYTKEREVTLAPLMRELDGPAGPEMQSPERGGSSKQ